MYDKIVLTRDEQEQRGLRPAPGKTSATSKLPARPADAAPAAAPTPASASTPAPSVDDAFTVHQAATTLVRWFDAIVAAASDPGPEQRGARAVARRDAKAELERPVVTMGKPLIVADPDGLARTEPVLGTRKQVEQDGDQHLIRVATYRPAASEPGPMQADQVRRVKSTELTSDPKRTTTATAERHEAIDLFAAKREGLKRIDAALAELDPNTHDDRALRRDAAELERGHLGAARRALTAATTEGAIRDALTSAGVAVTPRVVGVAGTAHSETVHHQHGAVKQFGTTVSDTDYAATGRTTTTKETLYTIDWLGLKATRVDSNAREHESYATGQTERTEDKGAHTAAVVDGKLVITGGGNHGTAVTDASGKPLARAGGAPQQRLVLDPHALGVAEDDVAIAPTADGGVATTTRSGGTTLRGNGVDVTAGHGVVHDGPTHRTERTVGADLGFTVDLTPVPDSHPPLFEITTSLRVGGTLGIGLGSPTPTKPAAPDAEPDAHKQSVKGGVALTAAYSHQLTADAARAYLADVDAAGAGTAVGKLPELSLLSRAKALAGELAAGRANTALAAFADPRAMAALPVGDHVDLTLAGTLALGASGSSGGRAGTVDATDAQTRTLSVRRVDDPRRPGRWLELTVGFTTTAARAISGTVGPTPVTVGAGTTRSDGDSATFRLDVDGPDYAAQFAQVRAIADRDQLRAATAALHAQVRAATEDHAHGTTGSVGVKLTVLGKEVGLGLATADDGATSVKREQLDTGLAVTATGTHKRSLTGSAGLLTGSHGETDTAKATADASGTALALSHQEDDQTTARQLARVVQQLPGKAQDALAAGGWIAMLWQSKLQATALWSKVATRLATLDLTAADVDAIAARAHDAARWSGCCLSSAIAPAWRALGATLASPELDPATAADADARLLIAIARASALADTVARLGSPAREALTRVARQWRGGAVLGAAAEWPPGADELKARCDDVVARAAALDVASATATTDAARCKVRDDGDHLLRDLGVAYVQLEDLTGWRDARAHAEMLDRLQRTRSAVAQCVTSPGAAEDTDALLARATARRCKDLAVELTSFKRDELALYHRIDAAVAGPRTAATIRSVLALLDQVGALHDYWIARIDELRAAYRAMGVAPPAWVVSAPGDAAHRRADREPDVEQRCARYASVSVNPDAFVAQWRARAAAY